MDVREAAAAATAGEDELIWSRETVPRVLQIVSPRLPQKDILSLLLISPWLYRNLVSWTFLWKVLDLPEMNNAGNRLISALSLDSLLFIIWLSLMITFLMIWKTSRYQYIKEINLEFAQGIEDRHIEILKSECMESLQELETLNLNCCQKIFDKGIEAISSSCPKLKTLSIYWNVGVTNLGIQHMVMNCRHLVDLNLSGCKVILDLKDIPFASMWTS